MTDFRAAFPDLNFWGTADLIAEGDYVVGRWAGGGTHTGPAFSDFSGRRIAGEYRPDDAVYRHDGSEARRTARLSRKSASTMASQRWSNWA